VWQPAPLTCDISKGNSIEHTDVPAALALAAVFFYPGITEMRNAYMEKEEAKKLKPETEGTG